jgi:hypothetical protein
VEEEAPGWEYEEGGPPGRGLAGPILISLGAVLFLVLVVAAVLLMMRDAGQPAPVPSATPTQTATATASPTPAPATTPPATTEAPPPTSFGPAPIEIPALNGQSFDQAATELRNRGLQVRRVDQTNATVPAGQVIGTDPPAGTLVVPGFTVDIIVSTGPAQPPTTTATTTPPN